MQVPSTRPHNQLLRALEPGAYARVAPKLKPIGLATRDIVYKPGEHIGRVYFPEDAVLCLLTVMANGDTIESATVGREGASWISAAVGAPSMPCETVVAIGGSALTLSIDDLDAELRENGHFRDVLTQYSHALLIASLRTSACSGLHALPQRCARWILTTLDRVGEDRFQVTHELLASFLGVRRASVSQVIEQFERSGILSIRRGQIRVTDRAALIEQSCECYGVIKDNYRQVGRPDEREERTGVSRTQRL
jgi:CRP-like cAMP-binding protein